MNERLKVLLSPLNFAGYLAWGGIGWELLVYRGSTPAWLSAPVPAVWLALLLLAFLGLFMAVTSGAASRRAGRAMVLAQIGIAFALMFVARNSTLPILMVLCSIQVVHVWSPRSSLWLILAANIGMYYVYRDVWQSDAAMIRTLMNLSFQAFAALTVLFAVRAEQARDALATSHADLLATRSLLAASTRDSERLRLSRELHDVAGHKLTALKLNLSALARDPRHAGEAQVLMCANLADELLADIRGVVQQMRRDDGLDLADAMAALATPFPRPRMHLQVADEAQVATLAQAEAVLRAVQEGLTNAVKHSRADNLWVVLRRDGDALRLDIRDDGRDTVEVRTGNGLCGMRERLEAVGGGLDVHRTDTGGVHLQAWLPAAA